MNDKELHEAVEQALAWEPVINASGIAISIENGVVTLRGHVDSYPEKREAEAAVARVRGVQAVVCDLQVTLPAGSERTDEDIARAASNAIAWNTLLPKGKIQVWVEKGRVTLEGVVDWQYQRKSADQCVRYLAGVRDVNNHIVVHPAADRMVVKGEIESALLRNAQLDANGIRVEVQGDHVILSGYVQSWVERKEAERAAWASPGVCHVDNRLMVNPLHAMMAI